ncbi:hypothetical protein V6K52_12895 [Knoellia sp. S7-12]|uniref:hypothetical protein n=1 Tax=Knoellia sp. S7-12 TaxID=3126698 RepID=UPI0033666074
MTWFAALAVVWLLMAALAWQAHKRGSARIARRWTTRLYAVTLVPLTALVVGVALIGVQLAFDQAGSEVAVAATTPYAQWLALAINLVAVDIVIRRRDVPARTRPGVTSTGPAGTQIHEAFTFGAASSPRP